MRCHLQPISYLEKLHYLNPGLSNFVASASLHLRLRRLETDGTLNQCCLCHRSLSTCSCLPDFVANICTTVYIKYQAKWRKGPLMSLRLVLSINCFYWSCYTCIVLLPYFLLSFFLLACVLIPLLSWRAVVKKTYLKIPPPCPAEAPLVLLLVCVRFCLTFLFILPFKLLFSENALSSELKVIFAGHIQSLDWKKSFCTLYVDRM